MDKLSQLEELITIVKADMRNADVPFDNDASFRIKKDLQPFGQCCTRYSSRYRRFCSDIFIAEHAFERGTAFLKNVICHELLHSAPECRGSNHKGAWRQFANQMNKRCPSYHITATIKQTAEEMAQTQQKHREKAKYCVQCNTCKLQVHYYKKGKIIKLLEEQKDLSHCSNLACVSCGGHSFKLEYLKPER